MTSKYKWYFRTLWVLIIASFSVIIVRLSGLQVVTTEGEDNYGAIAESSMETKIPEYGTRGQILDRNGMLLATDVQVLNLEFYRDPSSNQAKNGEYSKSIWKVIQLLRKEGKDVSFPFWLKRDESGAWVFDANTTNEGVSKAREKMFKDNFYVSKYAIEDIYERLCYNYMIHDIDKDLPADQKLTEADKITVLSVWQEMQMKAFTSMPILLATNVSWNTVTEVETRMATLSGISVSVTNQRVYPKGMLASHILGYTGLMQSKTQIQNYAEKGYLPNDMIGLDGVEASMEPWLTPNSLNRRGSKTVEVDRAGKPVRELSRIAPEDGNTVKLTIDAELQSVVERELASVISDIRKHEESLVTNNSWLEENKLYLQKYAEDGTVIDYAQNGAVVVLDMKCRVLAMASYPGFDPNWFTQGMTTEQYVQLMEDPRRPLFNNAIMAADTPGSVFKMSTALAALANGDLTLEDRISDEGPFTDFDPTNPPKCWIKPHLIGQHANQTVVEGLEHSCNYFFYTIAALMGSNGAKQYQYAAKLGLASKTNIDLPGERKSVVGSQASLYDPTRPITLDAQDTSIPYLVKQTLIKHLKEKGKEWNITYSEERLEKCVKALMDMAVYKDQGEQGKNWVANVRPILMEELGMSREMVYKDSITGEIARRLNEIKWGGSNTIMSAIGQSITQTSPIAMARYIAAIANGGYVYDVQLIDSIIGSGGETVKKIDEPTLVNDLSGEIGQYLPAIKLGMHKVVDETGTAADYFEGWDYLTQIAGKTGTAEKGDIDIESNAWFVAFAPFDEPEIAVVIYVPYGFSGARCAPAARNIIEYYLENKVSNTEAILPAPNGLAQ